MTPEQLLGQDSGHVVALFEAHFLQAKVAVAFERLACDAKAAGFSMHIASAFRSFDRQLAIFNGKACGERAVHDDDGAVLNRQALTPEQWLAAILRFSALPGTSRHHWGTDLDVFDAAALPVGQQVQLTPQEVAAGGIFDPFHCWLDERIAQGRSHGFFRPYDCDRGGVACERWHLSYAPLSLSYAKQLSAPLLLKAWCALPEPGLAMLDLMAPQLEALLRRYVAVGEDWCQPSLL